MSRLEEVKKNQNNLDMAVETINGLIDLDQHTVTNLNLTAINQQLVDISTTLAIIADNLNVTSKYFIGKG